MKLFMKHLDVNVFVYTVYIQKETIRSHRTFTTNTVSTSAFYYRH